MNLRQLEHLMALAEEGSFSRAAERMHLTQSALSRSLQGLEDELGARLVDRTGRRSTLTPLGEAVLARARRIVLEAARSSAAPSCCARARRAPSAWGSAPAPAHC